MRTTFFRRPTSQRTVTLVPLNAPLAPVQLTFKQVDSHVGCVKGEPPDYSSEVPIALDAYLNVPTEPGYSPERPFRALVIYLAVAFARALTISELPVNLLPSYAPRSIISAAVDVTGDGKPDILTTTYCCQGGGKSPQLEDCDYTCSDYYLQRNGRCVIVERIRPC